MEKGNKIKDYKIEEKHFENLLQPIDNSGNMKIDLPKEKVQQITGKINIKGLEEDKQIITADIRKDYLKQKRTRFANIVFTVCRPCQTCRFPTPPDLEEWLEDYPDIQNAIKFQSDNGEILSYPDWNNTAKYLLQMAFESAWFNQTYENLRLPDPLPNYADLEDDQEVFTITAGVFASHLFIAYLAVSLAKAVKGTWSISTYNIEELENLLDGTQMFQFISNINNEYVGGYLFKVSTFGRAIPSPPGVITSFLLEKNLYTLNRKKMISNIINWCRENLAHYISGLPPANTRAMDAHWHYRGDPPVTKMIEGTICTDDLEQRLKHYTAGCHGTTGFLRSICRTLNIPVKTKYVGSHSLPCFINDELYLSHGDDPYNAHYKTTPLPNEENLLAEGEKFLPNAEYILIDKETYENWFEISDYDQREENVNRRPREFAIEFISDVLLHAHCEDLNEGRTHEESSVYESWGFFGHYTVAELESLNLWEKIEAKITAWGGCENLPDSEYFPSP
ncbi:MAG: hypothetical protein GPJ52_02550 [Candidatus Heimdallarchaeota archaeon]|nr:hypothetical protein [Candidatus Heimdallarchaeota archaeon]